MLVCWLWRCDGLVCWWLCAGCFCCATVCALCCSKGNCATTYRKKKRESTIKFRLANRYCGLSTDHPTFRWFKMKIYPWINTKEKKLGWRRTLRASHWVTIIDHILWFGNGTNRELTISVRCCFLHYWVFCRWKDVDDKEITQNRQLILTFSFKGSNWYPIIGTYH